MKENIGTVAYIVIVIVIITLSSCGTSHLTQKQVKINYELDKLWVEYKYKSDSLITELYTK